MQILVSSNLNAIYEKEEEDITETIKNTSIKQIKSQTENIILIQNNNLLQVKKHSNIFLSSKDSINHKSQQLLESPSLIQIPISSKPISIYQHMSSNEEIRKSKECLVSSQQQDIIIYPDKGKYYTNNSNIITYKEALNYYSSLFILSKVSKNKIDNVQRVKSHSKVCCLKRILYRYINRYRLDHELKSEKAMILYTSDIEYDRNNEIHLQMLKTIFQSVNKTNNNLSKSTIEGKEWEIYFSSNTPLFPIDKGGIYSMIQILFIIQKYPTFFNEIVDLFNDEVLKQNYIIKVLCSITVLCLKYINENELNVYFNHKKNIPETICEFYIGLIFQMKIYLSENASKPLSYTNICNSFEKTKKDSIKTPSSIFWKYKQFKEIYQEEDNSFILSRSSAKS